MPIPKSFNPFGPPVALTQPEEEKPKTPAVQTPTVQTPTVQTPAVQTPAVQTPTVQTPAVQTPTVQTPTVQTPAVQTPAAVDPDVQKLFGPPLRKNAPETATEPTSEKPRSVDEIYYSVSKGDTNPLGIESMYTQARKLELQDYYHNTLKPAYDAYQKAEEGYKAGKVSEADYQKARQEYSFLYYSSQGLYDAYDTLKNRDNLLNMRGASSADIEAALQKWDAAYKEATASLEGADKHLAELQTKYDTCAAALSADWAALNKDYDALSNAIKAFNKSRNRTKAKAAELNGRLADLQKRQEELVKRQSELDTMGDDYVKAISKYNADSWLVGDMGFVLNTGADMWKDQFYREHPTELYMSEIGAEYDENNQVVGVKTNYQDLFKQIDDLYAQREGASEADLEKINQRIATYNSVMNTGLAFANLSLEDLASAKQFFVEQAAPLERELAELSYLDDIDRAIANNMPYEIPEGHDPVADRKLRDELQTRYNRIKSWENKVATRKYEKAYDPKIAALKPETRALVDQYILSVADPDGSDLGDPEILNDQYTQTITPAGFIDSTRTKRALKQALLDEGIEADEVERILKYVDYEANAARVTNLTTSDQTTGRTSMAEDAANAGLVSNFMAQLLLGLGSGTGAVENIAQYVTGREIDPNLGEAAPIDFNSFGNLGTIAAQEIDRGEYMRMQDLAAKLTSDKEWQERLSNLMHGAYGLFESMAQSAVIGMMSGAGWKSSMLLLSGSAASSTMQEMHQQGYSDSAVVAGGIISGFAEYITEKVSIEHLLDVFNRGELAGLSKTELAKRIGVNLLTQTVAEASEEGASDLINLAYDQYIGKLLNGGLTQIEMQATMMQQENPGMSWKEALEAAHADWMKEFRNDVIGGALSGLMMGAGGFAGGYVSGSLNARSTGKTLLQQGNDAAMYDAVEKLKGSIAAQAAGLNSEVRAASPVQLGRMYGSWMNAKTMQAIEGRLTELGVTDITPELLRGINAGAAGDYLLPGERTAVETCREATQVMKELQDLNEAMRAGKDTDNLEQWTLDLEAEQSQTDFLYRETNIPQLQLNNQTVSAAEAQYNAAKESNPDATVMNQVQEDLEKAGMQAKDAVKQGELLTKIFNGELLTGKEMRALDLNNPAVNKVFVERSGLTGVPKTGITYKMKQTYANQVTRQNIVIKQTQEDLKAGATELGKQITRRTAERTKAMQQEINNAQKNPIQKFFTSGKTKAAARVEAARQAAEEKVAAQFKPGTSDHEVARQVEKLTGVSVYPRSLYTALAKQQLGVETLSAQQQAAIDQQYTDYIYGLGLSDSLTRALLNAPAGTAATEAVAGQVVYDKSVDQAKLMEELNDPESIRGVSIKVLQAVAEEFGLKIVLYETRNINGTWAAVAPDGAITTDNGWYDPKDKSIHLDINAGDNGQGVMLFTAAHELTHLIKDVSPTQYEALKKFLFEKLNLQGENTVNDLVKAQIRKAKAQGRSLSVAKAEEEVVADACSVMLSRGDVVQSMTQLQSENKGLWQRIVDKIRSIFEKMTSLYAKMDPDTAEGKMVANMADSFSEFQQLWMGGLGEASTKLSEMAPKDIDGNPGPIQYSTRSMVQGSGLTYRESDGAVLDRNGNEVKNVTPEMMHDTPLGKLVQDAVQIGGISEKDAKVQYKFLSELMNQIIEKRDAALIWEIAGTQMFSAIRSNSDTQYGKTIDFSTICKKTQQMVDVMSGAMMELGHGLNRQQVEMAYRKTIEAGEPVPCPVCYVFSRWIGIGGILDDMHVFQQQYAGMSETELRGFMTGIEQQARDFVEDKIKNAKDKDAARKKYYDKNGVLKLGFAMSEMKSPLNTKIQNARNKINKSLDNSLQIQALEAEAEEAKKLGVPFKFTSQNAESIKALRKAVLSEAQLEKLEADIAKYEEQLRPIEAYQYLNGTIALRGDDGEWVKNPNFKPVPDNVLFNLNAGSEFATNYPYSWKYRTTRGCAAGKAMLPYSDARVGETIQGIRYNNVNDIYTNAEDNPFLNGEETDRQKDLEAARAKQRRQNLIGGQRYQSTSDFRFEYGSDYLITFMEMQAIGANVQLYTKVIEAVDFLATMGADINMSVMPLGNGYIENEDGTRTLVFSPVTGINGDAAIEMAKKYDNAQLILVGISDEHIRTALAGTDVTFVIPFHGSGNSTANIQTLMDMLDEALDVTSARDYTAVQTDHVRTDGTKEQKAHWQAMRDLRLAIITGNAANLTAQQQALLNENQYLADLWQRFYVEGVDEKTYQCFLAKAQAEQIFPYEYWDKNSTYDNADVNGDRFQEYCALMGIVPRFSGINAKGENVGFGDFTKDKGYWKLLIDRSMYTNRYDDQGNWIGYGKYRDQSPINCTNFNVETLDPSWAKATYGNVMTAENDPTKTSAIVKAVVDEVVREVQGGERVDVMHSGRGAAALSDEVNADTVVEELEDHVFSDPEIGERVMHSVRENQKDWNPLRDKDGNVVLVYKAFYAYDGGLYPPMISNMSDQEKKKVTNAVSGTLSGLDTPGGVVLDAEVGQLARYKADATEYDVQFRKLWKGSSKAIKRIKAELKAEGFNTKSGLNADARAAAEAKMEQEFPKLKAASKEKIVERAGELVRNESGRLAVVNSKGGGTLAFRPGWHLGQWPNLRQFDVDDPVTGKERSAMPDSLVFCACEIAGDIDYQLEAMELGMTANGGFDRTQAGLPYVPVDGYYKYRTNADPTTEPWYITGAIKVVEVLDDEDCRRICAQYGVTPQPRVSHKDIDLAKYGLKRGPIAAPSAEKLQAYRKSQAAIQNEAALAEALADPTFQDAYASRPINFNDKEIQAEFARNYQDAEYYRNLYEQRHSARNTSSAEQAAELLDKQMGKGTAKNLEALVRKYEQRAENAEKQAEFERAQAKLQRQQFKKELAAAKRTSDKLQKAQGRLLRITNNELNKAKRENQRRETALKKKMADLATDKAWEVGLAKSQGANRLAQQKRDYESKLRMKDRDITNTRKWARGLARSREQNARAEEKRLAKEKLGLQKLVLSLPGSAAIAERRKFNIKAKKVDMINGGSNVCTPIHFNNEADTTLPEKAAAFSQKVKDLYGSYYRKMHNDVAELDKAAKLQTRTDNLSTMINVCRASAATPEVFYHTAMVDKAGNVIGPSFKDLLLCTDENGKFDPKMQAALQDYMYHKHNVDRMSLESRAVQRVQDFINNGRQWLLDMANTELAQLAADGNQTVREYVQLMHWANNVKNKAVMPDADNYAVNAQASQELCDLYEREMPWLKDKAEEIYKYWDLFMREWAVGTSISEADYEDMRAMYPHYVPTYRVQEGQKARVTRTQNGIVTGEMTKAAKGSTKELLSLEDQFVKSMQNIVRGARLNDVARNLIEELLFDDEGVFSDFGVYDWESASSAMRQTFWDFDDQENEQRIEKLTMDGKEVYRISCWVDGEKMSAYVNRAMFEGMQALSGYQSDLARSLTKIGNKITKPMKAMITGYNPFFAAKNIIRDQHTALTNSQAGIAYEIYMGKAAAKIASNSDEWATFQALGGVSNTQTRLEGGFVRAMQPEAGAKKAVGWALEKVGAMGEYSEAVSRFAEYLAVVDMLGGDTYENRLAAIRAAAEVTVDFGRGGSWGRVINAWVPYWNANMQGIDKMVRNIAEQPDIKSMLARTSRAVMVNLIPAALQAAFIYALGRWKDYEELSDQQKDNYYCFPVIGKEHKFVKIPKSQDWAAFISTPFLRIMEGVNGRDDPWEGWFESAVMPQMPFDTRTVLGVENVPVLLPLPAEWALELAENKNYAGGAIIPYNLLEASAKEQFDADTSVLAYYFGKIFKGSPMALDYIIDDYMGNFWGVLAKSLPISPLASRGMFTGEASVAEKLADMKVTIMSPFITDSRVSNSTLAAYYDMIHELEQEVTDAGAHGDKKDAEHYKIYEALTQAGGYVDQIRAITNEAREHIKGDEQNQIRWEAVGLADMAMEFVEKCLAGEIKDPELWMTYAPYGDTILGEAEALKKHEDDFNYDGQLGKPKVFYDRTGDVDIKYDLESNPEWQREYVALRADAYRNTLNTVIKSADYQNDTDAGKAARLEAAKRTALKNAETQMIQYLDDIKAAGETIGKIDYSAEQRAAAYSVSWLMGESGAYKPEITDQFVDLYDYHEQYSFIPTDAAKKTFKTPGVSDQVYVLDKNQQKKYAEVYHDEITDAYTKVMAAPEFKSASPELRAAMLAKAKTYANDSIAERFDAWLQQTGAKATTVEKASPDISLEAKYAVQRALGDDHAMQREVTDELVRLYQYSDVGEVEYFPIATAPKSYVDDRDRNYIWELSAEQREVYMGMMFDTYQKNILKVMNSSQYKKADDYGKAQLLCDVRSRLSGDVQSQFKHWLRTTKAPRTYRKSPEAKAQEDAIKAADKIVDKILGKARTYKDFNKRYGW